MKYEDMISTNNILFQEVSRLNISDSIQKILKKNNINYIIELVCLKEEDLPKIGLSYLQIRLIKNRLKFCKCSFGENFKKYEKRFNSYWKNGVF